MSTQDIDSLIIGAAQAGLATRYQLKRRGRDTAYVAQPITDHTSARAAIAA